MQQKVRALTDAHVHLDFATNARELALQASQQGLILFANTVTPQGYLAARDTFAGIQGIHVGLGLHPWWIAEGSCDSRDVALACDLVSDTHWIGEVGLDFSAKRDRHEEQAAAFSAVAAACAAAGDRVISIHSVRAAGAVLDILESTSCAASCVCIFHWFSGSTDDLWRAIRLGCWFSVNEMQARTRRAKEQLKLIPEDRLLFETDYPPRPNERYELAEFTESLARSRQLAHAIRS